LGTTVSLARLLVSQGTTEPSNVVLVLLETTASAYLPTVFVEIIVFLYSKELVASAAAALAD
jgi:hypothetical protein